MKTVAADMALRRPARARVAVSLIRSWPPPTSVPTAYHGEVRNAEMLSDAMAEDFPSRILKGGERVVGSFDKTFDRMTKLATDLYGWASGDGGRK